MRCGVEEMQFIRRNSEGPLPQQRNGADGEATGPRWSSTGPARHQHWSGQGSSRKFWCFRNCRPRSTPSCPATRAGLQQTALHDGRSQQRAVVRCWWPLHPSLHADADTALDRWDSPACPNSPNNASRQFTNSRRAPHRKRGARRFSIPKGSACQAAAGWVMGTHRHVRRTLQMKVE